MAEHLTPSAVHAQSSVPLKCSAPGFGGLQDLFGRDTLCHALTVSSIQPVSGDSLRQHHLCSDNSVCHVLAIHTLHHNKVL